MDYDAVVCGRAQLTASGPELVEAFDLDEVPVLEPRYNIAPTQDLDVVRLHPALRRRRLGRLAWGLLAPEPRTGATRLINTRVETIAARPAFREGLLSRRCLIPVTGFYEWERRGRLRQPYLIRRRDAKPFALAGLWEHESGTILTTPANPLIAALHDRMPLILDPRHFDLWLDPGRQGLRELGPLFQPAPPDAFEILSVSPLLNDANREGPEVAVPTPPAEDPQRSLF